MLTRFVATGLVLNMVLGACAEVPKEAPQLSMTIGSDIAAMQASHRQVVHALFDQLRNRRLDYLKYEWTPVFVRDFAKIGKIREIAAGDVVMDVVKGEFVAPKAGLEEVQMLESVVGWSQEAVYQIEVKRKELLSPLDKKEVEILASIDDGYSRMLAANAQVTGLLSSMRDVQTLQDDLLEQIGLGGVREQINDQLVGISNWAETGLENVRKADELVAKAVN